MKSGPRSCSDGVKRYDRGPDFTELLYSKHYWPLSFCWENTPNLQDHWAGVQRIFLAEGRNKTFRVKKHLFFRNPPDFSFFGPVEWTEYVGTSIFRDLFKKLIFEGFYCSEGSRKVPQPLLSNLEIPRFHTKNQDFGYFRVFLFFCRFPRNFAGTFLRFGTPPKKTSCLKSLSLDTQF